MTFLITIKKIFMFFEILSNIFIRALYFMPQISSVM